MYKPLLNPIQIHTNIVVVNGRWGKWGAFTKCTKTCGGGIRERFRQCNNPAPDNGGKKCHGFSVEQQKCNTKTCGR